MVFSLLVNVEGKKKCIALFSSLCNLPNVRHYNGGLRTVTKCRNAISSILFEECRCLCP